MKKYSWLDEKLACMTTDELIIEAEVSGNKVRCMTEALNRGPLKSAYTEEDLSMEIDYLNAVLDELDDREVRFGGI